MSTLKKFIFISTFSLFLLHGLNGFSQPTEQRNYFPAIGVQIKGLQTNNEQETIASSIFFKSSYINNPEKSFSLGASAYPSFTYSSSKNLGTVKFGVELPITLELYAKNVEHIDHNTFNYFFIGFGATTGFYNIRELENIYGIGPHFVLGGNLPIFRGIIGYKGSMSYFGKSLQATVGLYYEIRYGY
jgi:hypothetical protein